YLFSGIVVVNLFGEVFGNATRSITGNQALVSKIYLPSELFPWASMIVALVHFLPQLLVLVVGALLFGWLPSPTGAVAFGLGLVILVVFTMGLGMITAALNAAFRDVENFVDLIVMVATWLSPVLYRISMVQDAIGGTLWWWLYQLNPLTIVVELFHVAFWRYAPPVVEGVPGDPSLVSPGEPFGLWWAGLLIAALTFVLGAVLFERSKRHFAQEVCEERGDEVEQRVGALRRRDPHRSRDGAHRARHQAVLAAPRPFAEGAGVLGAAAQEARRLLPRARGRGPHRARGRDRGADRLQRLGQVDAAEDDLRSALPRPRPGAAARARRRADRGGRRLPPRPLGPGERLPQRRDPGHDP